MTKNKNEETTIEPGKQVSTDVEAQLKKELAELNNRVGPPPSNKISTKNKLFTLPNGDSNPTLSGIILDWRYTPAHYPGVFDPKNPQDPDCFAVGVSSPDSGELAPHPNVAEPHSDNCKTCPKNQWGSAATGRGKACKSQIRLIVAPGEGLSERTMPLSLFVSPKGNKNWLGYLRELNSLHQALPIQVLTEITFDPNETYPLLQFKFGGRHEEVMMAMQLRNMHQELIDRPIVDSTSKEQQKAA